MMEVYKYIKKNIVTTTTKGITTTLSTLLSSFTTATATATATSVNSTWIEQGVEKVAEQGGEAIVNNDNGMFVMVVILLTVFLMDVLKNIRTT